MTKDTDKKSKIKVPQPKTGQQPSYVAMAGGYQSAKGGHAGGGKRPAATGSPIRRTAPGGGGGGGK